MSALGSTARYDPRESIFRSDAVSLGCPRCRGPLTDGNGSYECRPCDAHYALVDGILRIASRSTTHGEFSSQEMKGLLTAAEAMGWRAVLERDIRKRAPAVVDLISDKRRSSFMELLPPLDGGVAVDMGCGFGGISFQLAGRFGRVFSLDSGLERLQFLNLIRKQENIGNITPVHHEDAAALPFVNGSVDLAVMVGVFEYLPLSYPTLAVSDVQERVLNELHRILKPGGCLYIGTKNRFGWPYLKGSADHNGLRFGPVLPTMLANWLTSRFYGKPYRIIVDSYSGYRRLLKNAGFADARVYWPVPGYQTPDHFDPLDLSGGASGTVNGSKGWRKGVLVALQRSGALKYIAPHFSIVARKAQA